VTAFHKDYRMNDPENTTPEMLIRATDIGTRNGLRYVYAGNLPGRVGDLEHTRCHRCHAVLVERYGYFIQQYRLTSGGGCPDCGTSIPGRWGAGFDGQITSTPFLPGTRRLRMV
jgi:pyruvate formate lyase activating enzyme